MGPLFSAIVVVSGLLLLLSGLLLLAVLVYPIAMLFYGWRRAIPLTGVVVIGIVASVTVALTFVTIVALGFGVGDTIDSSERAAALIALLMVAGAGLVGGGSAWWWYSKRFNQQI